MTPDAREQQVATNRCMLVARSRTFDPWLPVRILTACGAVEIAASHAMVRGAQAR